MTAVYRCGGYPSNESISYSIGKDTRLGRATFTRFHVRSASEHLKLLADGIA